MSLYTLKEEISLYCDNDNGSFFIIMVLELLTDRIAIVTSTKCVFKAETSVGDINNN